MRRKTSAVAMLVLMALVSAVRADPPAGQAGLTPEKTTEAQGLIRQLSDREFKNSDPTSCLC